MIRKILVITLAIFISGCAGYEIKYNKDSINYYVTEVKFDQDDKTSKKLSKKLLNSGRPESTNSITLILDTIVTERILSKDGKGNPKILEIVMKTNLEIILNGKQNKKIEIVNSFNVDNRSDKFDLAQYKKETKKLLIDKIFDRIVKELRSI